MRFIVDLDDSTIGEIKSKTGISVDSGSDMEKAIGILLNDSNAVEWVKCSERMPPDNKIVIVVTEETVYTACHDSGEWYSPVDGFAFGEDPIAWMSIPLTEILIEAP